MSDFLLVAGPKTRRFERIVLPNEVQLADFESLTVHESTCNKVVLSANVAGEPIGLLIYDRKYKPEQTRMFWSSSIVQLDDRMGLSFQRFLLNGDILLQNVLVESGQSSYFFRYLDLRARIWNVYLSVVEPNVLVHEKGEYLLYYYV
jgi:hypothetical protein